MKKWLSQNSLNVVITYFDEKLQFSNQFKNLAPKRYPNELKYAYDTLICFQTKIGFSE